MGSLRDKIARYLGLLAPDLDSHRSYDFGDGLMARHRYADAARAYGRYLHENPLDTSALLRMCGALEAAGRAAEALSALEDARRKSILREDNSDDPALNASVMGRDFRQQRILTLTYVIGDMLVEKLNDIPRARLLYEETLEQLYGYPPVDALRQRLKMLKEIRKQPPSVKAPDRLKLE